MIRPPDAADGDGRRCGALHGLYGTRFAVQSSDTFAKAIGYPSSPLDDLLTFHMVFGKTTPEISLNAIANLGYASCRFLKPVYPGDTLSLDFGGHRPQGELQPRDGHGLRALDGAQPERRSRARILPLGDGAQARQGVADRPRPSCRSCRACRAEGSRRSRCRRLIVGKYDFALAGSPHRWGDYEVGEKIDHVDGMTLEEAEHQIATRLYQNTAKVHFNQHTESKGRFGKRIVYGGVVISLARALSFNGLGNAFHLAAINGGRHVSPRLCRRYGLCLVGDSGKG